MEPEYPPTIIFGSQMPDLRFRSQGGRHIYFCRKNSNLHLCDDDFVEGTFEAGRLLGRLCKEFCRPGRGWTAPCPAFIASHKVFVDDKSLASVEARPLPDPTRCQGVQTLLEMTETEEERFFLSTYLERPSSTRPVGATTLSRIGTSTAAASKPIRSLRLEARSSMRPCGARCAFPR
jgi:hypothetical protein